MLSDRHRWPKIAMLLLALATLCAWYSWQASRLSVGFALCLEDPALHDGREVELSLWRVQDVEQGLYRVSKVELGVPVRGNSDGLEPGDTVSVRGHFDADTLLIVEDYREVHHLRRLKATMGAIALLLFTLYAALRFRWRDGGLVALG